jgi:hypothetical protein
MEVIESIYSFSFFSVKKLHELPVEGKILGSSVLDPYVLLLLKDVESSSVVNMMLISTKDNNSLIPHAIPVNKVLYIGICGNAV